MEETRVHAEIPDEPNCPICMDCGYVLDNEECTPLVCCSEPNRVPPEKILPCWECKWIN